MDWLLMRDGLVLGTFKMNEEKKKLEFIKDEGIEDTWLPLMIYCGNDRDMREVLNEWFKDRVVPPHRIGIKHILKLNKIKEYDYMQMAKNSRASMVEDPFWVAMEETDTYKTSTIRGYCKPKDYNSLNIKEEGKYRWRI